MKTIILNRAKTAWGVFFARLFFGKKLGNRLINFLEDATGEDWVDVDEAEEQHKQNPIINWWINL